MTKNADIDNHCYLESHLNLSLSSVCVSKYKALENINNGYGIYSDCCY